MVQPAVLRAVVPFLSIMLTACGGAPPPAPPAPPPLGQFPLRILSLAEVAGARAALAKACPLPTADDPTPGLSSGARRDDIRRMRHMRWCHETPFSRWMTLESALASTPRRSPERPKILAERAWLAFYLERAFYDECRERWAGKRDPPPEERAAFVKEAEKIIELFYSWRREALTNCIQSLREHPDAVPDICAR